MEFAVGFALGFLAAFALVGLVAFSLGVWLLWYLAGGRDKVQA